MMATDSHDCQSEMLNGLTYVTSTISKICLLYTSDAADEEDSVDLGGRRIIKKKKKRKEEAAHKN